MEVYSDTVTSVALAARTGNLQLLTRLLDEGRPAHSSDNRGWHPLHEAAAKGHADCVSLLAKQELVNLNWKTHEGETALFLACRHLPDTKDTIHRLLKLPVSVNRSTNEQCTPLQFACVKGEAEVAKWLVRRGARLDVANVWGETPVLCAVKKGWLDLEEEEVRLNIVKYLIKHGATVDVADENKLTPLMLSAMNGWKSICEFLLDIEPELVDKRAEDGATALMLAAQTGRTDCVKLLLDRHADPNLSSDDGALAVHLACGGRGSLDVLDLLLAVTPGSLIEKACTPVQNQLSMPKQLDKVPLSPFHIAIDWENFDCLTLLASRLLPQKYNIPLLCPLHTWSRERGESCPDLNHQLKCSYFPYTHQSPISCLLSKTISPQIVDSVSLLLPKSVEPKCEPDCIPPLVSLALSESLSPGRDRLTIPFSPSSTSWEALDLLVSSGETIPLSGVWLLGSYGNPCALAALIKKGIISPLILIKPEMLTNARGLLATVEGTNETTIVSHICATGLLASMCLGNITTMAWVRDLHDTITSVQRNFWSPNLTILDEMYERVGRPATLQELARVAIHRALGSNSPIKAIPTLNKEGTYMPDPLVKYLFFNGLDCESLEKSFKKAIVELNNFSL